MIWYPLNYCIWLNLKMTHLFVVAAVAAVNPLKWSEADAVWVFEGRVGNQCGGGRRCRRHWNSSWPSSGSGVLANRIQSWYQFLCMYYRNLGRNLIVIVKYMPWSSKRIVLFIQMALTERPNEMKTWNKKWLKVFQIFIGRKMLQSIFTPLEAT